MPPSSPLRVALDVTPLVGHRTGIGRVADALFHGLRDRDEVDVDGLLISARGGAEIASSLGSGVTIRRTRLPARAGRWWWRSAPPPLDGFGGLGGSSRGLDVVHGINFVLPPHRAKAGLVTVHDLTAWTHPERVDGVSLDLPTLVARAVRRGAHVHVPSSHVGRLVETHVGVPADRVHVIHNGIDPITPVDPAAGRAHTGGRPYLLSVGTIEPRKGLPVLVEALAGLPDDLVLVVAGRPGWGDDELSAAIVRHGVADRVVRTGAIDGPTLAALMSGAEMLVYPSLDEGFGLPPLEAMSAGLPVVTTSAGALPEIVGDAAPLVPPGDPAALRQAIEAMMSDMATRRRCIEAGHERVAEFCWPDRVTEFVGLYRELV